MGDAILCLVGGFVIQNLSIHVYSMSVDIGRVCLTAQHGYLSDKAELGISHAIVMKNLLWHVIKDIEHHEVLSDFFFASCDSLCSVTDLFRHWKMIKKY